MSNVLFDGGNSWPSLDFTKIVIFQIRNQELNSFENNHSRISQSTSRVPFRLIKIAAPSRNCVEGLFVCSQLAVSLQPWD